MNWRYELAQEAFRTLLRAASSPHPDLVESIEALGRYLYVLGSNLYPGEVTGRPHNDLLAQWRTGSFREEEDQTDWLNLDTLFDAPEAPTIVLEWAREHRPGSHWNLYRAVTHDGTPNDNGPLWPDIFAVDSIELRAIDRALHRAMSVLRGSPEERVVTVHVLRGQDLPIGGFTVSVEPGSEPRTSEW